jgi:hypothetical protein
MTLRNGPHSACVVVPLDVLALKLWLDQHMQPLNTSYSLRKRIWNTVDKAIHEIHVTLGRR